MNVLRKKIQKYIEDSNLTIATFEKKLNVTRNTIYHILTNKSKSPGIETVIKIANALSCSLDSLCGRKEFLDNLIKDGYLDDEKFSIDLITEATSFILNFLKHNKVKITKISKLSFAISEICGYSFDKKSPTIDSVFAKRLCNNIFIKKNYK